MFVFNTGLIVFHIRLCCGKISTFDYIIAKRALRGNGINKTGGNNKTYKQTKQHESVEVD